MGIVGPNGTGKTTLLNIFSGRLIPNLSKDNQTWDKVIDVFSGSEVGDYLRRIAKGELKVSYKPQNITALAKAGPEKVNDLLEQMNERSRKDEVVKALGIEYLLKRNLGELSGGELQRVAIAATLSKKADIYFFDEPGSFLDVYERVRASRAIKQFTEKVFVVEHDLVMLDYLVDEVHITYGRPGSYGAVSLRKGVRVGINEFLEGFLSAENVRMRPEPLKFVKAAEAGTHPVRVTFFSDMKVKLGDFSLEVGEGEIRSQEIIGILGRNAVGKTTFIKMLAGVVKPDKGGVEREVAVSYKPQYFEAPDREVGEMFHSLRLGKDINLNRDIYSPLDIIHLLDRNAKDLSGGELQRVAIGLCLAQEADLFLLDEPSAFLDSEQRLKVAKLLKRLMQNSGKAAIVVEHDLMFLDYVSDKLIVFTGEPAVKGKTIGPMNVKEGMNLFLKSVDITLRRDPNTHRPRINKPASQKDKEQKASGDWYESL